MKFDIECDDEYYSSFKMLMQCEGVKIEFVFKNDSPYYAWISEGEKQFDPEKEQALMKSIYFKHGNDYHSLWDLFDKAHNASYDLLDELRQQDADDLAHARYLSSPQSTGRI